jgi:hypothetical protein
MGDHMEAVTRGVAREWRDTVESSQKRFFGPLKIGPFLLGGSGPIHNLSLIDVNQRGVYLTFSERTLLAENDVFRVVRPLTRRTDPTLASGQPRRIVAEVKVVKVTGRTSVLVQVLRGSVIKGLGAERRGG